jgi:hypothetical protein
MVIRVQYNDNRYDMVKDFWLDEMIASNKISRFCRSDGWVTIGVDPVRGTKKDVSYSGPERRRIESYAQISSSA